MRSGRVFAKPWVQKGKAGRCGAHLGLNRAVKACRVDGVGDERRHTGGGSGRWRRRGPRDSWIPTGSFRVVLRNQGRGQRDRRKTGGAESTGRSFSPAAGLGGNPAAAQAGVAVGGFGEVTGVGAKMLRGLEPTAGRWSGVAGVEQSFCAGWSNVAAAARVGGGTWRGG